MEDWPGACWTTGALNERAMLLSRGGGVLDVVAEWGGGGGFQCVSHCVKTDVDGNMKAKHRRHHTIKCVKL